MEDFSELLEQLEYPLPSVKADAEEIYVETHGPCSGAFTLRNAGGSTLSGSVASGLRALEFSPEKFTGNRVAVNYAFNPPNGLYKQNDKVKTNIVVSTNGGELIIPFTAEITPKPLDAGNGVSLNSLRDFTEYARELPQKAAVLFADAEFGEWLAGMDYEHMEIYEHLRLDSNAERGTDNFLFLSGLKQKAGLSLPERETVISVKPGSGETSGVIGVTRSGWGYLDAQVGVKQKKPWLELITSRLSSGDFRRGFAAIDYVISPERLNSRDFSDIYIKTPDAELTHRIFAGFQPILKARLNKQSFSFSDKGSVFLENNTGGDLIVEAIPGDPFLVFEGRRYMIGASAEIPFEVKLTSLRLAQLKDRSGPVVSSEITVRTASSGKTVFSRSLSLGVTDIRGLA